LVECRASSSARQEAVQLEKPVLLLISLLAQEQAAMTAVVELMQLGGKLFASIF
jgi:hypothetical protein